MTINNISLRNKIRSSLQIFAAYKKGDFGNPEDAFTTHENFLKYYENETGKAIAGKRVLDLGCGQMATQAILFDADGAVATGFDLEIPTFKMSADVFFQVWKLNGAERAFKSLIRHILFDWHLKNELHNLVHNKTGKSINFEKIDIKTGSADLLPFPSNSFDLICSSCVFEHIEKHKISDSVREINRVMKPEGRAIITIHLFPSLSGGHNLAWRHPDKITVPPKVQPWDHLLEYQFPANTFLNKLRLRDYIKYFYTNISLGKVETESAGELWLTPDLEKRLTSDKTYTRDDLLTEMATFYCQKLLME